MWTRLLSTTIALWSIKAGWVIAALTVLFSLNSCQTYDTLIEKDAIAEEKWANYQAALQRRYDLIPNLVETVKAAAKSEQEILTKVSEARAAATGITLKGADLSDPEKVKAFQAAQDQLKGTLSRLMVANERYPELKSNDNFKRLQVELEGTENRILRSREEYNKAVREYNVELGKIRGSAVNKVTGQPFKPRVSFAAAEAATAAPKVSF